MTISLHWWMLPIILMVAAFGCWGKGLVSPANGGMFSGFEEGILGMILFVAAIACFIGGLIS